MPNQTPNLKLTKPHEDDFYDVTVPNGNMDIIDREITDLKQSGVNGKNQLEAAVIAKEGTVSKQGPVATFEELDNGIRSIPVGIDTGDATATADEIVKGKTAYAKGSKVTGNIDKDKLLTLVNAAEAGNSAIKSNVASLLNAVSSMNPLGLTNASTWADIQAKIPLISTGKKWLNGRVTMSNNTEYDVNTVFTTGIMIVTAMQFTSGEKYITFIGRDANGTVSTYGTAIEKLKIECIYLTKWKIKITGSGIYDVYFTLWEV